MTYQREPQPDWEPDRIDLVTRFIKETKPWLAEAAPMWMRKLEYAIRVKVCGQRGYLFVHYTVVEDSIEPGHISEDLFQRLKALEDSVVLDDFDSGAPPDLNVELDRMKKKLRDIFR